MVKMLLFSYANWDEILQACIGLCGDEGIKYDNLHRLGGIPGNTGEGTEPLINEPAEALERKNEHEHDVA